MKKPITIEQLTTFKFLSNLQASPNQQKALFTVTDMDEKKDTYHHNLWLYENDQLLQLTSSNKDGLSIFDDNETILFASSRNESKDNETTSFYRISTQGGEAKKAFDLKVIVSKIEKIKDHHYLIQALSDIKDPDLFNYDDKKRKEVLTNRKDDAYYDIIEGLPFWFNGAQLIDQKRQRLFIYDEIKNELTPLTDINFNVNSFHMTDSHILVNGNSYTDINPLYSHLLEIDLMTLETTPLIDSTEWDMGLIHVLNDEIIVQSGSLHTNMLNQNSQFRKVDRLNKTLVDLDNQELLLGNSIGSDVRFGTSKSTLLIDNTIVYNATIRDHSELMQFDGLQSKTLLSFDGSIDGFVNIEGQWLIIGQYQQTLSELHIIEEQVVKTLSNFNDLSDHYISIPQTFEFESNNDNLTGYVLLPQDFDPNKTYPAILDIHGGPKTVYGKLFYHEMQVWASMGTVVFYTNPHGSDGVNDAYSDIFGRYGSIDYDDLMTLTDEVLQRYPNIDTNRLGVTGGSYGGFMTNWIIGHTNRFKVAATQRSISNWISFYGVSDIGYFFVEDQTHGGIYSDDQIIKAWEQSPLKYINQMETPTLIVHSKFDYRCPIDQGYQLFTALKNKGVNTKMLVLNEENHDLSRSGKPKARLVRLREITEWLHSYLNKA